MPAFAAGAGAPRGYAIHCDQLRATPRHATARRRLRLRGHRRHAERRQPRIPWSGAQGERYLPTRWRQCAHQPAISDSSVAEARFRLARAKTCRATPLESSRIGCHAPNTRSSERRPCHFVLRILLPVCGEGPATDGKYTRRSWCREEAQRTHPARRQRPFGCLLRDRFWQ